MKINTALILCAGYGKRLNPLTLKNPKPLLKVKDLTFLERTIKLIKNLGIKKIIINSYQKTYVETKSALKWRETKLSESGREIRKGQI